MDMMVGVDLSDEPEAVLARALPWAARLGARLHLRAVSQMLWDPDEVFGGTETQALAQEWERRRHQEQERLSSLTSTIPDRCQGAHEILQGTAGRALVGAAQHFDLAVVGTHGRRGLERMFLGSVAERVVREAPCPVLVVPFVSEPLLHEGPIRAVFPVDAAEPSLAGLARLRAWFGDALEAHLVYGLTDLRLSQEIGMDLPVAETPDRHPHREWAAGELKRALDEAGETASLHFVLSMGNNPAVELAGFIEANQADVVALPTHGRRGLARVAFGSVAERLVRHAHAPTLVLR